jgi:hypothetical protein
MQIRNVVHKGLRRLIKEAAMGATAGIRMKRPAHPGGFVKHEIIEPLELSVTAAGAGARRHPRDAVGAPQ